MGGAVTALTICIPTVPARQSLLSRLLFTLERQIDEGVEVLIADGSRPMGDKLNEMFAVAAGRYVVAVDDDDLLADDYWPTVRQAVIERRDFIGYDILWLEDGRFAGIVRHSLDGDPLWRSLNRAVSPKCPVRTELAREVSFGNEYTADRLWSLEVYKRCQTGVHVPLALYTYDHWNDHMLGTEPSDLRHHRPQRDVGQWPFTPSRFTWLPA